MLLLLSLNLGRTSIWEVLAFAGKVPLGSKLPCKCESLLDKLNFWTVYFIAMEETTALASAVLVAMALIRP